MEQQSAPLKKRGRPPKPKMENEGPPGPAKKRGRPSKATIAAREAENQRIREVMQLLSAPPEPPINNQDEQNAQRGNEVIPQEQMMEDAPVAPDGDENESKEAVPVLENNVEGGSEVVEQEARAQNGGGEGEQSPNRDAPQEAADPPEGVVNGGEEAQNVQRHSPNRNEGAARGIEPERIGFQRVQRNPVVPNVLNGGNGFLHDFQNGMIPAGQVVPEAVVADQIGMQAIPAVNFGLPYMGNGFLGPIGPPPPAVPPNDGPVQGVIGQVMNPQNYNNLNPYAFPPNVYGDPNFPPNYFPPNYPPNPQNVPYHPPPPSTVPPTDILKHEMMFFQYGFPDIPNIFSWPWYKVDAYFQTHLPANHYIEFSNLFPQKKFDISFLILFVTADIRDIPQGMSPELFRNLKGIMTVLLQEYGKGHFLTWQEHIKQ